MKLFLDSSVILAGCGRPAGASRYVLESAETRWWTLQVTPYVLEEVSLNVRRLGADALDALGRFLPGLHVLPDVVSFPWVNVFPAGKDRPILFSAFAWSDVLLTLDRRDFLELLGNDFYGFPILKPGPFLQLQRGPTE